MRTDTVEKSFCTTREAAQLLGVSVGTVQLWVESGLLEAWKTAGGHRRVIRSSLDQLLRQPPSVAWVAKNVDVSTSSRDEPLTVMVVEDDPDLLRLYTVKLGSWPIRLRLRCFDNAFEALLKIGSGPPDLLIADLQMPGIDGFKMLRAIHSTPEMKVSTIVAVSGMDAAAIKQMGGVPPGIEVLSKPIPFDRLLAIAENVAHNKLTAV
jgi:excisionase family DNA binding protein